MSLEGRIHRLSTRAVASESPEEVHDLMAELRAALREHHLRAKKMAAQQFLSSRTDWRGSDSTNLPEEEQPSKKKKAKDPKKEEKIYFFFLAGRS